MITSYGDVVPLNSSDLRALRADESDPFVARVLETQTRQLADRNIYPAVVIPAKAGALIIASTATDAERALDAVFGVPELDRTSRRAARAAEKITGLKEGMLNSFGFAATGQFVPLPIGNEFRKAVDAQPANSAFEPKALVYEDDMRLAA